MALTTFEGKGAPLTAQEMDNNIKTIPGGALSPFWTGDNDVRITFSEWATFIIKTVGPTDAILQLVANGDFDADWTIRNDFSENNALDFRFNNVSKLRLEQNGDFSPQKIKTQENRVDNKCLYTDTNSGQNTFNALYFDGNDLNLMNISGSWAAEITIKNTATNSFGTFCKYIAERNGLSDDWYLTHIAGNSIADGNKPYINVNEDNNLAWRMDHASDYPVSIQVEIIGNLGDY